MIRGLCLCLLVPFLLLAQDRSRAIDHLQSDVGELRERMRHSKVERELLEDRVQSQIQELADLKKEFSRYTEAQAASNKNEGLQNRIASIEKGQTALLDDLKQLKKHLNETSEALNRLSDHTESNQNVIKTQVHDLKRALESMARLLQKPGTASNTYSSSGSYKVKPGDSLEKIARATGITVDQIKKFNDLSSDKITVGQELKLP